MRNRAIRSKRGRNGSSVAGMPNGNASSAGQKAGGAKAKQTFERYVSMAKAAATAGDAVESEKYYQYADHFLRLMKAGAH